MIYGALHDRRSGFYLHRQSLFNEAIVRNHDLAHRFARVRVLEGHMGCVNTVCFSPTGETLVSGSDDQRIILWDFATGQQRLAFNSKHRNNVFQARIVAHSGDRVLISCAADGQVRSHHLQSDGGVTSTLLAQHYGRAHKLSVDPGAHQCFLSCGEDGIVRHFDLREPRAGNRVLFAAYAILPGGQPPRPGSMSALGINAVHHNPIDPTKFALGGDDEYVQIYDMRKLDTGRAGAAGGSPRRSAQSGSQMVGSSDGDDEDDDSDMDFAMRFGMIRMPPEPRVGDAPIGQPVGTLCPLHLRVHLPGPPRGPYHVTCVQYSPSGELLATYHDDDLYLFAPDGATEASVANRYAALSLPPPPPPPPPEPPSPRQPRRQRRRILRAAAPRDPSDEEEDSVEEACSDADEGDSDDRTDDEGGGAGRELRAEDVVGTGEEWSRVVQCYWGHRNQQTVKGCAFAGPNAEYVVSGSDCGRLFVWSKRDGAIQAVRRGDNDVVNCLEQHPVLPMTMATSGIDDSVKIWAPTAEEPTVPGEREEEVRVRNVRNRQLPPVSLLANLRRQHIRHVLQMLAEAQGREPRDGQGFTFEELYSASEGSDDEDYDGNDDDGNEEEGGEASEGARGAAGAAEVADGAGAAAAGAGAEAAAGAGAGGVVGGGSDAGGSDGEREERRAVRAALIAEAQEEEEEEEEEVLGRGAQRRRAWAQQAQERAQDRRDGGRANRRRARDRRNPTQWLQD
ncbi:unnamed protein product [Pedinophyceae sp. YPF-701]|nr:unnamed protein product [Pedinophyceae sp. YPF-701]